MKEQKSYRFTEEEVLQILAEYIATENNIEFNKFESEITVDFEADDGDQIEITVYI